MTYLILKFFLIEIEFPLFLIVDSEKYVLISKSKCIQNDYIYVILLVTTKHTI